MKYIKKPSSKAIDALIAIEFLDHSKNHDKPITCRLFGILTEIHDHHLIIVPWMGYKPNGEYDTDDIESFSILIRNILKFSTLAVPQWMKKPPTTI